MQLHKQNFLDSVKAPKQGFPYAKTLIGLILFAAISVSTYGGLDFAQEKYFQNVETQDLVSLSSGKEVGKVLGEAVQNLGKLYSLAWLGAKATPYVEFANNILGDKDSVKTYLILFQNNAEIRPSGGFLGSYARVKIVSGRVTEFEIPGQGFYGLEGSRVVSVAAPKPLTVFSPQLQVWNSNVFADFPTSAQMISRFYEKSGGETVDGVVSISPVLLERLLVLTGPIEILELKKTVSAENAYRTLQEHVEFEYDKTKNQPKEILSLLAPRLLDRLLVLDPAQYMTVAKVVAEQLSKKQILAYFADPDQQSFLEEHGWDGKMLEYGGRGGTGGTGSNYLMIVHMNVGGGKTDYVVETRESLDSYMLANGGVRNTVTITRSHTGDPKDALVGLPNIDYVRVYAPRGARLIETEGFKGLPAEAFKPTDPGLSKDEIIASIEHDPFIVEEDGTRVVREIYGGIGGEGGIGERFYTSFGNWMIVKPGETTTAKITYEVAGVGGVQGGNPIKKFLKKLFFQKTQSSYSLIWQKQPGMDSVAQVVRVIVPKGSSVVSAYPEPQVRNQNELIWQTVSERDHGFVVGLE